MCGIINLVNVILTHSHNEQFIVFGGDYLVAVLYFFIKLESNLALSQEVEVAN